MADPYRSRGPQAAAARMRRRCCRHSPAWRATMARLEADLVEALRGPQGPLKILPPGGPDLTDQQRRQLQRLDPTGRMRKHTRRSLLSALRSDGTFDGLVMVKTCRAFGVLPWEVGIAPHRSRLGSNTKESE